MHTRRDVEEGRVTLRLTVALLVAQARQIHICMDLEPFAPRNSICDVRDQVPEFRPWQRRL